MHAKLLAEQTADTKDIYAEARHAISGSALVVLITLAMTVGKYKQVICEQNTNTSKFSRNDPSVEQARLLGVKKSNMWSSIPDCINSCITFTFIWKLEKHLLHEKDT